MNRQLGMILLAFCAVLPSVGLSQAYPSRPVRVVVPFPPGGAMDLVVRPVSQEMSKALGQQVVVENKPGAGTVIGADAAAKSPPDGYTLLCIATSFTANHTLVQKLPYDSLKDFRPISLLVRTPHVIAGKPTLAAKDFGELVRWAKANPGRLSYGSPGNGTGQHLAFESLKLSEGIDIVHVPYKGEAPAITDVMGGQLDLVIGNLTTALPHIRAGKLRAFGVGSRERTQFANDIATISEQGLPNFESMSWFALVTQARVPNQVVSRLNREVVAALSLPQVRNGLIARGFEPAPTTPEELGAIIRTGIEKSAAVIKAANIKLD